MQCKKRIALDHATLGLCWLRYALVENIVNPLIVTLCGSIKFKQAFIDANFNETMAGNIVLSVGCFGHADHAILTEKEKQALGNLHKRKIDMSDEILVLNVGGYIGKSTEGEIEYARVRGKGVRFLEN